jgi:hypothetical protein
MCCAAHSACCAVLYIQGSPVLSKCTTSYRLGPITSSTKPQPGHLIIRKTNVQGWLATLLWQMVNKALTGGDTCICGNNNGTPTHHSVWCLRDTISNITIVRSRCIKCNRQIPQRLLRFISPQNIVVNARPQQIPKGLAFCKIQRCSS